MSPTDRWEHQDRGDYGLERFDREFQERLYSEEGRRIMEKHKTAVPDERCLEAVKAWLDSNHWAPSLRIQESLIALLARREREAVEQATQAQMSAEDLQALLDRERRLARIEALKNLRDEVCPGIDMGDVIDAELSRLRGGKA